VISSVLPFPHYYGRNLNALWDVMSTDIEGPVELIWKNIEVSRRCFPDRCEKIIELLKEVEQFDIEMNFEDKFTLILEE